MTVPTRERIRDAAGELFCEYGYGGVTVRSVADAADVSPALVMKLFGSKAALYGAATRAPRPDSASGGISPDQLGARLVHDVAERLSRGERDPWCQSVFLAWQSPSVEVERRAFADLVHRSIAEHLGDGIPRECLDAATCLLVGLAVGLRALHLRDDTHPCEQSRFLEHYATLVQSALAGRP